MFQDHIVSGLDDGVNGVDDPVPCQDVQLRDLGLAAPRAHHHALAEDVVEVPLDPDKKSVNAYGQDLYQ